MERPPEHLVDAAGKRLLRSQLEPSGWTLNETGSGNDYGVDFDVEVFERGHSTGTTFKLQLKSTANGQVSVDGSFVSVELTRSHLEYWLSLRSPLVLALANLADDKIVWTLPQARKELREQLGASREQKTFTIRIPSEQHLGHGTDPIRESVSSTALLLSAESIREASLGSFIESSKLASDPNALIKTFEEKAAALRLEQADRAFRLGNRDEAATLLQGARIDDASEPGQRFAAILIREKLELQACARNGGQAGDVSMIGLAAAKELQAVAPRGRRDMRL
jgi:hypothetical protein